MSVRRPRVPVELAERIDRVRAGVPFEVWVRQALEQALESSGSEAWSGGPRSASPSSGSSAPARASSLVVERESSPVRSAPVQRSSGRPERSAADLARQARMNKAKGL